MLHCVWEDSGFNLYHLLQASTSMSTKLDSSSLCSQVVARCVVVGRTQVWTKLDKTRKDKTVLLLSRVATTSQLLQTPTLKTPSERFLSPVKTKGRRYYWSYDQYNTNTILLNTVYNTILYTIGTQYWSTDTILSRKPIPIWHTLNSVPARIE